MFECLQQDKKNVYFVKTNEQYRPSWIKNFKVIRAFFRLSFYLLSIWNIAGKVKLFHVLSNSGWAWFLFSAPVLMIAKVRGIPVVINYRGGKADAFFERSWKWVYPSLKSASDITVPTRFLHSVFKRREVNTNIVPNIIDLELFQPRQSVNKSQKYHFIVTRNLEKIYGNDIAIKAFKLILNKYPKSTLTIAGSGPEKNNLEQLVKSLELQDSVYFAGKLERRQMAELYQSADIMLNASTIDNTPNSIIEPLEHGITHNSPQQGIFTRRRGDAEEIQHGIPQ